MSSTAGAPRQFRVVVFKQAEATSDFTCSERVLLPGQHDREGAWRALRGALACDASLIGGEIQPAP